MIVQAVIQLLLGEATVTAIIDDRGFPRFMPDGVAFPALVVTKVSGIGHYDMEGDVGIESGRFQVDCYSDKGEAAVVSLKSAVRRKLSGFKGEASPLCCITSCFLVNDLDMSEASTERAGPRLKRRMIEFSYWAREICSQNSDGIPSSEGGDWILTGGFWNDGGVWQDSAAWED